MMNSQLSFPATDNNKVYVGFDLGLQGEGGLIRGSATVPTSNSAKTVHIRPKCICFPPRKFLYVILHKIKYMHVKSCTSPTHTMYERATNMTYHSMTLSYLISFTNNTFSLILKYWQFFILKGKRSCDTTKIDECIKSCLNHFSSENQ